MANRLPTTGGPNALVGLVSASLNIGGTGTFKVGTGGFTLATNTNTGATPANATGTINLNGGTLQSNSDITIAPGPTHDSTDTLGTINLAGGTLDLLDTQTTPPKPHHDIGTAALPITLNVTSGTLKDIGTINGTAGVTKAGPFLLTISGNNLYTGDTTVQAGTVVVNGKLVGSGTVAAPTGTVTLTSGAGFLAGAGGSMGAVSISSGAAIHPGAIDETDGHIGTLTMASLTNTGADMRFDLTSPGGSNDSIVVTGAASFSAQRFQWQALPLRAPIP